MSLSYYDTTMLSMSITVKYVDLMWERHINCNTQMYEYENEHEVTMKEHAIKHYVLQCKSLQKHQRFAMWFIRKII